MKLGRILRFGTIGLVNTATYYVLYLLLRQPFPYLAAHVLAFATAMVGSYFLNCYFTFRTRPTLKKFLLFPLSNVTNFIVTSVGLYVLVKMFRFDERFAPILAAIVAIPVTFIVAQYILVGPAQPTISAPAAGADADPMSTGEREISR